MKLKIVSNDIELQKRFSETKYFDEVIITSEFTIDKGVKYILVSDKLISFNTFIEKLTPEIRESSSVIYMLSGNPDSLLKNYNSVLKAKGVICIPPKLTQSQIVERVCKEIGIAKNTSRNIATFFGADRKIGTTITTQAIAETIAKNSDTTVGLLFLNGHPSTDYVPPETDFNVGIDKIKVKIMNNVLSANELLESCIKDGNLYILPGAEIIYEARHYHPSHIENLVELASKVFGMVIIDAGSNLESGMSIGALNCTNNRFLITTQQDSVLSNFNRINEQILSELDFNTNDFMLIINKYLSNNHLYSASDLAGIYKMTLAGIVPYVDYAWQVERSRNTFLSYNSSEYNSQIFELARLVCSQMDIEFKYVERKKKFFGLL